MASACIVSAIVTHIAATALLLAALATSHWITIGWINRTGLCACSRCDCGVWFFCPRGGRQQSGCTWFLGSDTNAEDKLPDWFKATQATLVLATAMSMTSLLMDLAVLCVTRNLHRVITVTSVLSAFLLTVAVSLFGTEVSHLPDVSVTIEGLDDKCHLGWSYWLAVAATCCAWAASCCSVFTCWHKCSPLYSV